MSKIKHTEKKFLIKKKPQWAVGQLPVTNTHIIVGDGTKIFEEIISVMKSINKKHKEHYTQAYD